MAPRLYIPVSLNEIKMLTELIHLNLSHWDAKYDHTKIESRLICCLSSVSPNDMDYWADDSITELFCEIADTLLLAGGGEGGGQKNKHGIH